MPAARKGRLVFLGFLLIAGALIALQYAAVAQGRQPAGEPSASGSLSRDFVVVLVLILFSSLFVAAEVAFLSIRRTRVEQLVEEGDRRARVAERLLSEPTRLLATIQVGLTLVQLFSAGEAANRFVMPLADVIREMAPGTILASGAAGISFVLVVGGVAFLTLVLGEVTPKSIAVLRSEPIALWAAYPIAWLQVLLSPVVGAVTWIARIFVTPLGGSVSFHTSALSEEELKIMVEQSEELGVIEREEKEMIHSIFEFGDTTVRQVMTPRLDVTAVEADAPLEQIVKVISESGHSRLPVYDDDLDNIIGILHAKDLLKSLYSSPGDARLSIRDMLRAPYFIPDGKRVDDLLAEFRKERRQFAIVRDEYGTMIGVVTIEDLLEEIVGEIQDEYDSEEPVMRQLDETTALIDGRMSLSDFNDRMGVELPEDEADTIGGFVFTLLGHQPSQGESTRWDGFEFQVEATDGRRIQKVRVVRTPPAAGEEGADSEPSSEDA
jgi:putative hemolysin